MPPRPFSDLLLSFEAQGLMGSLERLMYGMHLFSGHNNDDCMFRCLHFHDWFWRLVRTLGSKLTLFFACCAAFDRRRLWIDGLPLFKDESHSISQISYDISLESRSSEMMKALPMLARTE